MNIALKSLLVGKYGFQVAACKALDLSEWRLTRIIHGWENARPEEIEALTNKFGIDAIASVFANKKLKKRKPDPVESSPWDGKEARDPDFDREDNLGEQG